MSIYQLSTKLNFKLHVIKLKKLKNLCVVIFAPLTGHIREASLIDFVHENSRNSYGRSSGDPPPPGRPLRKSRTFFDFTQAPGALFILQPLRLSVVPGPDNRHTYILKI